MTRAMEDMTIQGMLSDGPEAVLRVARLACLNDMERYFGDDTDDGQSVISYRNEAAALSLILQQLETADGEGLLMGLFAWHACGANWQTSGEQGCLTTTNGNS